MRLFLAVVDRGGYSAAARELGTAQATVSYHVKELERELGAQLLVYERRTLRLTAAGRETYRSALMMVRAEQDLKRSIRDAVSGDGGRLRFGATIAFEHQSFFDDVVAPFVRNRSGMLLSLRFGHSRGLSQNVVDGVLDLAYVMDWSLPPDPPFEELHRATLCFFVPPKHPLSVGAAVDVAAIADAGLISAPLSDLESTHYHQLLHDRGFADHRPTVEIDGVQARVLAAKAGLGVLATFRPDHLRDQRFEGLQPLVVEGDDVGVRVGLTRRPGTEDTASAIAFVEWLRARTSPPPGRA